MSCHGPFNQWHSHQLQILSVSMTVTFSDSEANLQKSSKADITRYMHFKLCSLQYTPKILELYSHWSVYFNSTTLLCHPSTLTQHSITRCYRTHPPLVKYSGALMLSTGILFLVPGLVSTVSQTSSVTEMMCPPAGIDGGESPRGFSTGFFANLPTYNYASSAAKNE